MSEAEVTRYITEAFAEVDVATASGGVFFFLDPARKFPFATLSTSDEYDQFSDLGRPGVFRLNIGVSKETFRALFGSHEVGHDYTAPDRLMPHPVYGKMYWVSVLNPDTTWEEAKRLLAEAYDTDARKHSREGGR